ncbi:hypothetical protein [Enhygromyxa salina]|uniref:hypothetical protein n=1 Tax=Enhygromyxa salina TaxID=215803 RepID=UPI0011B240D0|nr:hypothetical protein [Enhygromyxa salina]
MKAFLAVAKGHVADIHKQRGDLGEALRICKDEQLPLLEEVGDPLEIAQAKGQLALILGAQGHIEDAIELFRHECLPILEHRDDRLSLVFARANLAGLLKRRDSPDQDEPEIVRLYSTALRDARTLGIPEAEMLADALRRLGHDPDA